MTSVAEGITTTHAALELARRYRVEMPITDQLHAVLFAGKSPHAAVDDLLSRAARDELTSQLVPPVDAAALGRAADGALLAQ